jgi:sulfide:quinone oxidoreductase
MPGEPPFRSQPVRVLIAGGGIAAIELLVALRKLAGERVEIELLAAGTHLTYRPLLVAEPFGMGTMHRFPLADIAADQRARQLRGTLVAVDAAAREVLTDGGERVTYDALAVATGARSVDALPGALSFAGPAAVAPMRALVERAAGGELGTVVFALPEPARSWPLPLYELALMTALRAPRARIVLVTSERMPLELFGTAVSEAVRERLELAGVELRADAQPLAFAGGELTLAGGERIETGAAVALPGLQVPPLEGLPQGDGGFVPTDDHGRVEGLEDVYAAGDVTAFPVKQGGVSVRQAQAVAECLAARAGAPVVPAPFEPLLRGMLFTGAAPSYLQLRAGESLLTDSPLWWPPTKIADSYLIPYLVARFQLSVSTVPGADEADLVSSTPAGDDIPARPAPPLGRAGG